MRKKIRLLLIVLAMTLGLLSCTFNVTEKNKGSSTEDSIVAVDKVGLEIEADGIYSSKEDVALYLHVYGVLPDNFMTKKEAEALGWQSSKGNLWDLAGQMSIGGDEFFNREKLLPIKDSRLYFECDINYKGGYRNAERIVYSNDGLIFYTDDHYESFTQLYGDE